MYGQNTMNESSQANRPVSRRGVFSRREMSAASRPSTSMRYDKAETDQCRNDRIFLEISNSFSI